MDVPRIVSHPVFPLTIRRLELESEKIHALGQHDDAISSVRYSSEASCVHLVSPHSIASDVTFPFFSLFRCHRYRFLGSYGPFLGPPRCELAAVLSLAPRTRLLHGHRRPPPCRSPREPPVPHFRRSQDGHARADARELPQIPHPGPRLHVRRPR